MLSNAEILEKVKEALKEKIDPNPSKFHTDPAWDRAEAIGFFAEEILDLIEKLEGK